MGKIPTTKLALVKKYASDIDGYIKVKVYVPDTYKPLYKTTKYKVPEKFWDEENEIVLKGFQDYRLINDQIAKSKNEVEDTFKDDLRRGVLFTKAYIENVLKPKTSDGEFLEFYHNHIRYRSVSCSPDYIEHFMIEKRKFGEYAGLNVLFSDITTTLLEGYEMSLKCATTTKNSKMKRLKEVIDKAVAMGKIKTENIAGYTFPSYEAPERPYLTLDETELIANSIYNGEFDYNARLKTVACYFLIECYSGIRFSDWGRFSVEKLVKDRSLKVRAKKNGEPVYLPLNVFTRLGKIVDYVRDSKIVYKLDSETNNLLKIMAIQLKIKKHITTHIGRHTCGTLLGEMGYNDNEIADVLGISPATASTYTKRTRKGLQSAFNRYGGL